MDKFSAMETFVRIVEKGSLTAAANALDTSLPTVVRVLASLERHLGVKLLHRTTRRIRLTEEGVLYLDRSRAILSAAHEAEEVLISREAELRGNLTVGASVLFGRRYVLPVVNDFLLRHPKMTVDLRFGDRVLNLDEGACGRCDQDCAPQGFLSGGHPGRQGAPGYLRIRPIPALQWHSEGARRHPQTPLRETYGFGAAQRMALQDRAAEYLYSDYKPDQLQ